MKKIFLFFIFIFSFSINCNAEIIKAEIEFKNQKTEFMTDTELFYSPEKFLLSNGYYAESLCIENQYVKTLWKCSDKISTEQADVISWTDKNALFTKIFFDYKNADLNFWCEYKNYIFKNGIYFPTIIKFYAESNSDRPEEIFIKNIEIQSFPQQSDSAIKTKTPNTEQKYLTTAPEIISMWSYTFYKKFITDQDIPGCIYTPSCSQYAQQAVAKYGPLGIFMALERLERCSSSEKKRNLYKKNSEGLFIDELK